MGVIPKASRRTLLRRGLLFVAGALGVGVAAEKIGRTSRPALSGPTIFKLQGRQWHLLSQDRRRGELPVQGDRVATYGMLHSATGEQVGEFYGSGHVLQNPLGALAVGAASLEVHSFNLADGTIAGVGSTRQGESVFAIVGGTGRYAGVSGSYIARQQPLEVGGDGTAEFTLTMKLEVAEHGG